MKKHLLKYLACPKCKGKLTISEIKKQKDAEIIHGKLRCNCGLIFPIKNGIPRMFYKTAQGVKKSSKAFSNEWNEFNYYDEEDDTWPGLNDKKRLERFMTAFNIKPEDLKGKIILDAGCGNARLSYNLSKLGAEVIAIDLSNSVDKAYHAYYNPNLHYIQGDLMNIPFLERKFDLIWSAGVLHHTPNTKKAFDNLVPRVKKNGKLYIWVYGWDPNSSNYRGKLIWNLWEILMKCPSFLQKSFGNFYVLVSIVFEFLKGGFPSKRFIMQRKRLYYDFLVPYMYHHSQDEVDCWFKEYNFANIVRPIEDYKTFCGFGTCGQRI